MEGVREQYILNSSCSSGTPQQCCQSDHGAHTAAVAGVAGRSSSNRVSQTVEPWLL
jgi:hypothetical protein